jgi:hypothetical protein
MRPVLVLSALSLLISSPVTQSLPASAISPEVTGFKGFSWVGPKRKWSYRMVEEGEGPVKEGKHSERFEIRAGDCGKTLDYNDCTHDREHIAWNETGSTKPGEPVRYTCSFYIDRDSPSFLNGVSVILAEWRPTGPGQINLSIELQEGNLVAVVGSTQIKQQDDMTPPKPALWRAIAYNVQPGEWYDLALEAIWSRKQNGKIRLSVNNREVVEHDGPNTAFSRPVHMQYGIYRPFVSRAKAKLPTQVIYFDNIHKEPITALRD